MLPIMRKSVGMLAVWVVLSGLIMLQGLDGSFRRGAWIITAASAAEDALIVGESGNVGIGTGIPGEAVDVRRVNKASRFQLTSSTDTGFQAPQFIQRRARSLGLSVQTGDNLGLISFRGATATHQFSGTRAGIVGQVTQNWSNTANGTMLVFLTTANGTTTPRGRMVITHDGRVLIGGIQVPDYVFKDDYDLMPLEELQAYIKREKHLPNVPSEQEVTQNKLDLGGTQMILLEKIEELTLYTLQQHEQIKEQEAEVEQLREENKALRMMFETRLVALEQQVGERQ